MSVRSELCAFVHACGVWLIMLAWLCVQGVCMCAAYQCVCVCVVALCIGVWMRVIDRFRGRESMVVCISYRMCVNILVVYVCVCVSVCVSATLAQCSICSRFMLVVTYRNASPRTQS